MSLNSLEAQRSALAQKLEALKNTPARYDLMNPQREQLEDMEVQIAKIDKLIASFKGNSSGSN